MTFGKRLIRARERAGYNQRQLADALHITPTRLNYWEKDKRQPDIAMLCALAEQLSVSADYLIGRPGLSVQRSEKAMQLAALYEKLDTRGKQTVDHVLQLEATYQQADLPVPKPQSVQTRIIPLFTSPAAAGFASPVLGEDYDMVEIPASEKGDFAVPIRGDSMEPYIQDGDTVRVLKTTELVSGDVGMFFVDGDMLCKQYLEDASGNIHLLSLNRARRDADRVILASGAQSLVCFGKVLLARRPPLPKI